MLRRLLRVNAHELLRISSDTGRVPFSAFAASSLPWGVCATQKPVRDMGFLCSMQCARQYSNSSARRVVDVSLTNLNELEQKLLHEFHEKRIIVQAMLHSSCPEHGIRLEQGNGTWTPLDGIGHNERCEWLGDRVLGLYISHFLYCRWPEHSEGALSKVGHVLVSRKNVNELCVNLDLHHHLITTPNQYFAGPDQVPTPDRFGNFLESCFAALFLDGGDAAVRRFFDARVKPLLEETLQNSERIPRNYRSELQEVLVLHGFDHADLGHKLKYVDLAVKQSASENVPSSRSLFYQSLQLYGRQMAIGVGQTKAEAVQNASQILLTRFENENVRETLQGLAAQEN